MKEKIFNRFVIIAIIISAVLVLDQLSKSIVYHMFANNINEPYLIEITSFFNIVLNWNYGISFGFMNDEAQSQGLLIAMSLIICILLFYWMVKSKEEDVHMPIGLIIGGALGNVADRLYYGAVVDFLDFHVFGYHYPAFNFADISIVLGAILLIFLPEVKKRKISRAAGKKNGVDAKKQKEGTNKSQGKVTVKSTGKSTKKPTKAKK
jgi:signal peptidase II